jgi:subtilisin-like proprotein convertase family protein
MKLLSRITICLIFFTTIAHAQNFSGTAGPISDDGQVNNFTAVVSGLTPPVITPAFGLVTVCIDITHTWDSDLNIHLVSPDGTEINLASGLGGSDDNYAATCFNQFAPQSIITGSAPFTGTYRPQETLGNMNNGQPGDGTWTLRILDMYPQDAGTVNSWSITFDTGAAAPFVFVSSNLPIVVINTNNLTIPDEPKINATMGIIYNGPGMINYVTDPMNDYNGNIGIEMRGAYSQSLPQKPYNIETRDTNGSEMNVSLLSMPPEHDWCLVANYNDKVFMRNVLAYRLFESMGNYGARTRFCEVMLNGSYQGIYILLESVKRDNNRVDIATLDSSDNTGLAVTGGYIIKNDYWSWNNSWVSNFHPIDHPSFDVHLVYHYPKPDKITFQQEAYIQDFINDMETALYSPAFADPQNGYRQYLDENSFVDYLIVNELSRNNDGFKKSSYFYKDKDDSVITSKLKAGPVWDFDWAWKDIPGCGIFAATDGSGWAHHINDCNPDVNSPGWYIRLLQDTAFQNTFRCRWNFFRNNILSNSALHNYIDSIAAVLDSAQARHFEKWGNLGVNTGTPEVQQDPPTFALHISQFKDWIDRRLAWLDDSIPGNPAGCGFTGIATSAGNSSMEIFPVPANDFLHIRMNGIRNSSFETVIYDISGREMMRKLCNGNELRLPLQELPDGFYILNVSGKDFIASRHFVIMH